MSGRKQLAAYATLVVVALLAITFGVASGAALKWRIERLGAGEAHRRILPGEQCASCHTSKHKAPLVGACENCHVKKTWQSVSYKHESRYLNSDAHVAAPCNRCHHNGNELKKATCSDCHKVYGHRQDTQCFVCHNTDSWTESHALPKSHPRLKGSHAKATCPDCHTIHDQDVTWYCADCHTNRKPHNAVVETPAHRKLRCVDCHRQEGKRDNLNTVVARAGECVRCHVPPHQALPKCERCHPSDSFKAKRYQHPAWQLRGAHTRLDCKKCHSVKKLGVAKGATCSACHGVRHGGLSDCARCHTQTAFRPSKFRHSSVYKLSGAHARLSCGQCHPGVRWTQSKGTACSSCHGTRHGGLSACSKCHTTASFKPSKFNHASRYPLTGAHTRISCAKCHPSNKYTQTKGRTCVACHGVKHGGQTDCSHCHTATAWQPIKPIAHTPRYPLIGQHQYVECIGCHKGLSFASTPTRCIDCHASLSHGMPRCESCHTPYSWSAVTNHGG